MMIYRAIVLGLVLALGGVLPAAAGLQREGGERGTVARDSVEALRAHYLLPAPQGVQARAVAIGFPGSSVSTPTAYGADWRDVFAGVVYQRRTRFAPRGMEDGAVAAGFGLGNARKLVGLELAFTVFDLFTEPERGDHVHDTYLSLKVHRRFSHQLGLAFGIENAVTLTGGPSDSGTSVYGVATKAVPLRSAARKPLSMVTLSLGVGNGRFLDEESFLSGEEGINVFGSVGLHVIRSIAAIADWTGQDLNVGLSIAPFRSIPLIVTPAFADVTGHAGDGARFIVGVGFGFSFF